MLKNFFQCAFKVTKGVGTRFPSCDTVGQVDSTRNTCLALFIHTLRQSQTHMFKLTG